MSVKKVLITDDCHPLLREQLALKGFICDFLPEITHEQAADVISDYTGLVINSKIRVNKDFLSRASRLRFVLRLGSGMEIVDRPAAAQQGIVVLSSPEGNRNAVAEQALGMLLALSNHLCRADAQVRQKIWQREANRGWEVWGKTIGIIGFGHTGSHFASKLSGMGMPVLAYDKYLTSGYAATMPWVQEVKSMAEICQKANIVSLHLPLTTETRHLVNRDFLEACRPGVVIINTSRGACVNTKDLVEAIDSQKVKGACLDVFENEKPSTFTAEEEQWYGRLYGMEQVVVSPHIAGWTHESKYKMAAVLLEKLQAHGWPGSTE